MLIFLIFFVFQASPSESNMVPEIELVNGRLSINVKDITLGAIFEKLHKETGVEFVLSKDCAEIRVAAELKAVPLRKALRRLLSKLSYAIIETDDNIERVIVLGKNSSPIISHINKLGTPSYSGDTIVESMQINTNNTNATPDGMKNSPSFTIAFSEGMGMKTSSSNKVSEGMTINMPATNGIPEDMSIKTTPTDTIPDGMQTEAFPTNMAPDYIENNASTVDSIPKDKDKKVSLENTILAGMEVETSYNTKVPKGMTYAPSIVSSED